MSKPTSSNFYETTFQAATPTQQAAFLKQLFTKDADLRQQFLNFLAAGKNEKQPILSFIDLEEYRKKVHEEISEMGFDMESVYKYFDQGDRSYVPGHEAAWEGAENMLRIEGFTPFAEEAKRFLKKGNLLDGIKIVLAMYEGHNDVYEPAYDEEDAFQDYNDVCLDIFKEKMQELLPLIGKAAQSTNDITTVFDLIEGRAQFWEAAYQESKAEDEWVDRNVVYDRKVFKPLLARLKKVQLKLSKRE